MHHIDNLHFDKFLLKNIVTVEMISTVIHEA